MQKTRRHLFLPLLTLALAACNHAPSQVAAASSGSEAAQDEGDSAPRSLQIGVSNTHRIYACHNQEDSVQVTGSNDTLTITGNCGSLHVTGNSNTITIDSVQSVQFTGQSNSVFYRSSHRPALSDLSQSNSLTHAGQVNPSDSKTGSSDSGTVTSGSEAAQDEGDSAPRSLQIGVSNTHRIYACHNREDSVQVAGSHDILTITGNCGSLQVTGNSNSITIDSVQSVQFTGQSNSVLYRSSQRPSLSDLGQSNSLTRAAGQVNPSRER